MDRRTLKELRRISNTLTAMVYLPFVVLGIAMAMTMEIASPLIITGLAFFFYAIEKYSVGCDRGADDKRFDGEKNSPEKKLR